MTGLVDWLMLFAASLTLCVLAMTIYLLMGMNMSDVGAFALGNLLGCFFVGGYILVRDK